MVSPKISTTPAACSKLSASECIGKSVNVFSYRQVSPADCQRTSLLIAAVSQIPPRLSEVSLPPFR